jgi:hypothetical protein
VRRFHGRMLQVNVRMAKHDGAPSPSLAPPLHRG